MRLTRNDPVDTLCCRRDTDSCRPGCRRPYVMARAIERWRWHHRRKLPQRPLRLTFGPPHSGFLHELPAGSGLWGRISEARRRYGPSRRAKAEDVNCDTPNSASGEFIDHGLRERQRRAHLYRPHPGDGDTPAHIADVEPLSGTRQYGGLFNDPGTIVVTPIRMIATRGYDFQERQG